MRQLSVRLTVSLRIYMSMNVPPVSFAPTVVQSKPL